MSGQRSSDIPWVPGDDDQERIASLERELARAVETRENANAASVRVEIENRRLERDLAEARERYATLEATLPDEDAEGVPCACRFDGEGNAKTLCEWHKASEAELAQVREEREERLRRARVKQAEADRLGDELEAAEARLSSLLGDQAVEAAAAALFNRDWPGCEWPGDCRVGDRVEYRAQARAVVSVLGEGS